MPSGYDFKEFKIKYTYSVIECEIELLITCFGFVIFSKLYIKGYTYLNKIFKIYLMYI